MDFIERPKQVNRAQKNYLTNEKYQDFSEKQFNNIYDYLDNFLRNLESKEKVLFNNLSNTSTTITLSDSVANYDEIEVFYRGTRENKAIRGSQKITDANGNYININWLFRVGTANKGSTTLYKVNGNTIALETGSQYEFSNGSVVSTNTNNNIYITKVIGRKEN